ncbi:hypothetical protein BDN70DRAFT_939594 [Pholiota conissans]|uniref:Uncharacterized protein n=1 Tax=Pholiota conissans TaxID=109636 RepID=A0A9P5YJR4_9AGAR|nr:hypothetical protein BDN70DRAFT_939594 [Pholiota conissans]
MKYYVYLQRRSADTFHNSAEFAVVQLNLHQTFNAISARFGLGDTPDILRDYLRNSEATISGSYPLLVLFPGLFIPNDLDVYLPYDVESAGWLFRHWIEDECGYTCVEVYDSDDGPYPFHNPYIFMVTKHEKRIGDNILSINLLCTTVNKLQIHSVLSYFPSTVAMNAICSEGFVSMYPALTVSQRGLELYPGRHEWISKYVGRGFDIREDLDAWLLFPHVCPYDGSCLRRIRRVGDHLTMFVPFIGSDSDESYPWSPWHIPNSSGLCDILFGKFSVKYSDVG